MANAFITRRAGTLLKNIANAEVTLDFSSVTYDGSQHAPKIQSVTMNGEPLTNLLHYYATITPQTDAGDYYVTVHGLGEYGGVKQVPWSIGKAQGSVSLAPDSITIQGELGTTGQVIITYEGDGELSISESRIVKAQILDYDPVLENNSWETIAQVAAAGMASKAWNLGDKKAFTIGDETYHAQIIGFNHDDLDATDEKYGDGDYNGGSGKAAITFQMEGIYSQTYRMDETSDNSCSWRDSEMRVTTMPKIKEQFDQAAVAVMRTVTKSTAHSQTDSTIYKTADVLFLLCHTEVFETQGNSHPGEGTQYAFYLAGNSKIKKYLSGSAAWWWLRSPSTSNYANFRIVNNDGTTGYNDAANNNAVAAGFCI